MTETVRIYNDDVDRVNELVDGNTDEMTWPAKINQMINKAEKYNHD